jgi:hypothetical protein
LDEFIISSSGRTADDEGEKIEAEAEKSRIETVEKAAAEE